MNIVITGAGQGLGAFLVQSFASVEGSRIIGIDNKKYTDIDPLLKPLFFKYYEADLELINSIPVLLEKIQSDLSVIDIFINNAGLKVFGNLEDLSIETIEKTFIVNSLAPIVIVKSLLTEINSSSRCVIINISSNAGFKGYKGGSIYCSSKAALNIFTEAIVDEYRQRPDIDIYTICPSTIFTQEIAEKYPEANPKNYIQKEKIFQEIQRLINRGSKRKIIPITTFKQTIKRVLNILRAN
jgi:short-subunit dehydrogenase